MDTYYLEMINKVKHLMLDQAYDKAYACIQEELSMPYIPADTEIELKELEKECKQVLFPKSQVILGDDELIAMMNSNEEQQIVAIEHLRSRNIRNYLDLIRAYLLKQTNPMLKALVIEIMMEQNVSDEFIIEKDGLELRFSPCAIVPIMDQDGLKVGAKLLKEWFENSNPSFFMMSMDTLLRESYLLLPMETNEEEAQCFTLNSVGKVYEAFGDSQGFDKFLLEHGFTKEDSLWSI